MTGRSCPLACAHDPDEASGEISLRLRVNEGAEQPRVRPCPICREATDIATALTYVLIPCVPLMATTRRVKGNARVPDL